MSELSNKFSINFNNFDLPNFLKNNSFDTVRQNFEYLFSLEMFIQVYSKEIFEIFDSELLLDELILSLFPSENIKVNDVRVFYSLKESSDRNLTTNSQLQNNEQIVMESFSDICASVGLKGDEITCWDDDLIQKNLETIDFELLSSNSSVRWDFELISKYEKEVFWGVAIKKEWEKYPIKITAKNILSYRPMGLIHNLNVNWTREIISKWRDNIDFLVLCSNEAINWNYDLIEEFQDYVVWGDISDDWYKRMAKNRLENCGLMYNSKILWTTKIVDRWKDKIDLWEITLNGRIDSDVLWIYRYELLEKKLFYRDYEGPRDDKEWNDYYKSGWDNVFSSNYLLTINTELLNFFYQNKILDIFHWDYKWHEKYSPSKLQFESYNRDFSSISLEDVIRNQYTWLPHLVKIFDFWKSCIFPLIKRNDSNVKEVIKNIIELDFREQIPEGSLFFKKDASQVVQVYRVERDRVNSMDVRRIIGTDSHEYFIDEKITKIGKPDRFNYKECISLFAQSSSTNTRYYIQHTDWKYEWESIESKWEWEMKSGYLSRPWQFQKFVESL